MAQPGYVINAATHPLAAATAETSVNLIAGAADRVTICEIGVSIDVATLCLVELCESTQAGAGTSTDSTASIKQTRGFAAIDTTAPSGVTARTAYTAEPTVLTRLRAWWFNGPGPFVMQFPLGREPESLLSGSTKYKGLAVRVTSVLASNANTYVEFE
jgi:hypothetical protein